MNIKRFQILVCSARASLEIFEKTWKVCITHSTGVEFSVDQCPLANPRGWGRATGPKVRRERVKMFWPLPFKSKFNSIGHLYHSIYVVSTLQGWSLWPLLPLRSAESTSANVHIRRSPIWGLLLHGLMKKGSASTYGSCWMAVFWLRFRLKATDRCLFRLRLRLPILHEI